MADGRRLDEQHPGRNVDLKTALASLSLALGAVLVGWTGKAPAATMPPPPHLGASGLADFAAYLTASAPKAFAVAPGGAWGWAADAQNGDDAENAALNRCATGSEQSCLLYARDHQRVFDDRRWPTLWRLDHKVLPSGSGLLRGAIFPDLSYRDADGRPRQLSATRGRVVVLHFWGSWCGPCRRELPDMANSARRLAGSRVTFIPLQVRESFATSRAWVEKQLIALPLFDSGARDAEGPPFRIAGGGTLPDRAVAPVFPSTLVLDRSGRVVFRHHGPIERWSEYEDFLRDLAK